MAEEAEAPEFYFEKARHAEQRAAMAHGEAERSAWRSLAKDNRQLALAIQEHAAFLAAMTR